jgi:uncharacterized membrane protein required for colicin V production
MILLSAVPALSAAGWVDAVCAVLLVVAVVVGSVRGLTGELSRLFALATALAVVSLAYAPIRENLLPDDGEGSRILAFAGAVLLAAVAGAVVRWGASRFLRMLVGQPADGIAGAVLAAFSTAIVLLMAFSFARLLPIPAVQETVFERSVAGRVALPIVDRLVDRAFRRAEAGRSAEPPPAPVAEPAPGPAAEAPAA